MNAIQSAKFKLNFLYVPSYFWANSWKNFRDKKLLLAFWKVIVTEFPCPRSKQQNNAHSWQIPLNIILMWHGILYSIRPFRPGLPPPSFIDTFTGIVLRRSGRLFQFLWGVSGPPEPQLIHTLSKFHCPARELYPTNHHSSLEHATYGTSCLLLAFLNPTTCHISNLRSINLIWSLSLLSLSLSLFLCWSFV